MSRRARARSAAVVAKSWQGIGNQPPPLVIAPADDRPPLPLGKGVSRTGSLGSRIVSFLRRANAVHGRGPHGFETGALAAVLGIRPQTPGRDRLNAKLEELRAEGRLYFDGREWWVTA
ncbi:MAG: hypothetical protein AB1627_02535 [Chloroflexota bacterium]